MDSMTQLRSVTCHMGSHSVTCYPTQVNTPRLHPSQAGWYSIYRPFKDRGLSKPRPRVHRATGPRLLCDCPRPARLEPRPLGYHVTQWLQRVFVCLVGMLRIRMTGDCETSGQPDNSGLPRKWPLNGMWMVVLHLCCFIGCFYCIHRSMEWLYII